MLTCTVISPLRARNGRTRAEHEAHAKLLCQRLARAGWAVYAGHLACPLFLDEDVESDRNLGIEINLAWIERSDRICIWDPWGVAGGMITEIEHAEKMNAERVIRDVSRDPASGEILVRPSGFHLRAILIHKFTRGEVPEWADLHSQR